MIHQLSITVLRVSQDEVKSVHFFHATGQRDSSRRAQPFFEVSLGADVKARNNKTEPLTALLVRRLFFFLLLGIFVSVALRCAAGVRENRAAQLSGKGCRGSALLHRCYLYRRLPMDRTYGTAGEEGGVTHARAWSRVCGSLFFFFATYWLDEVVGGGEGGSYVSAPSKQPEAGRGLGGWRWRRWRRWGVGERTSVE